MLEQISTSRDQYTLIEQSYVLTKQSNETCNVFFVQVSNGAFYTSDV